MPLAHIRNIIILTRWVEEILHHHPMRWHNVGQFASELSPCDTPPSPPAFNVGARVYVVQDFRELHHRVFFVVKRLQC